MADQFPQIRPEQLIAQQQIVHHRQMMAASDQAAAIEQFTAVGTDLQGLVDRAADIEQRLDDANIP